MEIFRKDLVRRDPRRSHIRSTDINADGVAVDDIGFHVSGCDALDAVVALDDALDILQLGNREWRAFLETLRSSEMHLSTRDLRGDHTGGTILHCSLYLAEESCEFDARKRGTVHGHFRRLCNLAHCSLIVAWDFEDLGS